MKKLLLIFIIIFNAIQIFALGRYESYNFEKITTDTTWGEISFWFLETTNKKNGITINGSPYLLKCFFETRSNRFFTAEILDIKVLYLDMTEQQIYVNPKPEYFEKSAGKDVWINSIEIYPFQTRYENQKLRIKFRLTSDTEVIEEETTIDLKLITKKWIGFDFWEKGKEI